MFLIGEERNGSVKVERIDRFLLGFLARDWKNIRDRPRDSCGGLDFASRNSELEFHSFHVGTSVWPSERSLHSNNTCRPGGV